jgi:hypothetical protein
MKIVAGLADIASTLGSFKLSSNRLLNIEVPKTAADGDITKLRRDCEILLERIKRSPGEFRNLVRLASSGNLPRAQALVQELKLTEEDFEKEGGGCFWLLVIIIIILCAREGK